MPSKQEQASICLFGVLGIPRTNRPQRRQQCGVLLTLHMAKSSLNGKRTCRSRSTAPFDWLNLLRHKHLQGDKAATSCLPGQGPLKSVPAPQFQHCTCSLRRLGTRLSYHPIKHSSSSSLLLHHISFQLPFRNQVSCYPVETHNPTPTHSRRSCTLPTNRACVEVPKLPISSTCHRPRVQVQPRKHKPPADIPKPPWPAL
jgi:hypothetical protein